MTHAEEVQAIRRLVPKLRAMTRDHETAVQTLVEDGSTMDWLVEATDLLEAYVDFYDECQKAGEA